MPHTTLGSNDNWWEIQFRGCGGNTDGGGVANGGRERKWMGIHPPAPISSVWWCGIQYVKMPESLQASRGLKFWPNHTGQSTQRGGGVGMTNKVCPTFSTPWPTPNRGIRRLGCVAIHGWCASPTGFLHVGVTVISPIRHKTVNLIAGFCGMEDVSKSSTHPNHQIPISPKPKKINKIKMKNEGKKLNILNTIKHFIIKNK